MPYDLLSPDELESFVRQALSILGPSLGFRLEGGALGSGDSGFDQFARRLRDNAGLCFQCKRLTATFHLSMIGRELAKVALRTAIEKSNVREHRIVTTGAVGGSLQSALRSVTRNELVTEALKALADGTDLLRVTEEARAAGIDPETTIRTYVTGLDVVDVWSRTTFDSYLGTVWAALEPVLARHFSLATVIKDNARPQFDARGYAEGISAARNSRHHTQIDAEPSSLPRNLRSQSSADPLSEARTNAILSVGDQPTIVDAVLTTRPGTMRILRATGGGGKSTTLSIAASAGAEAFLDDPNGLLPVQVSLKAFGTSVHALVERALRTNGGDWLSLPHKFLLLCDGVDEISPDLYVPAIAELHDFVKAGHACVLSLRELGLSAPIEVDVPCDAWRIAPLSGVQILEIASRALPSPLNQEFQDAVRDRLHTDFGGQLFSTPFWLVSAAAVFRNARALPVGKSELLESLIGYAFAHNQVRLATSNARLAQVPIETVRALANGVAYRIRVVQQRASVAESVARAVVRDTVADLKSAGAYAIDSVRARV